MIANSKKRAEQSERLMYDRVCDYLRSGYRHHRLLSRAVNHYRDNAITYKASATKCQRTEAGERGNYWQMRQRDVAARSMQNTRRVS